MSLAGLYLNNGACKDIFVILDAFLVKYVCLQVARHAYQRDFGKKGKRELGWEEREGENVGVEKEEEGEGQCVCVRERVRVPLPLLYSTCPKYLQGAIQPPPKACQFCTRSYVGA